MIKFFLFLISIFDSNLMADIVAEARILKSKPSGFPYVIEITVTNYQPDTLVIFDISETFYFFWNLVVLDDSSKTVYYLKNECNKNQFSQVRICSGDSYTDSVSLIPNKFYLDSIPYGCTPFKENMRFYLEYRNNGKKPKHCLPMPNQNFAGEFFVGSFKTNILTISEFSIELLKKEWGEIYKLYENPEIRQTCIDKPFKFKLKEDSVLQNYKK